MTSKEIRQQFIRFFEERDHLFVPSSPVVPLDDPTLKFANAGMNQFKDVFLGTGSRDYRRAANTQKCIRAGGKHNDLDDVGHDTYHHTFFEMLGSWSFGDYFKEDAIRWAWQLLHETWGIPKERLHITYFGGDEEDRLGPDHEAKELWLDVTGVDPKNVHACGKKDNFWEMAETGPCGPCSEIHVDLTQDLSGGPLVNADDPRVFEIWNLVFIQYNRDASQALSQLPARHIDTGMGFERLVTVLQGKYSNYDTDVFSPLMTAIRQVSDAPAYGGRMAIGAKPSDDEMRDVTYRIIADHLRCLSFAIADGAEPDKKDRGFVVRRILRRAYRYGHRYLGMREPFLYRLVPTLVDQMGEQFPELVARQDEVTAAIQQDEALFDRTLEQGLRLFAVATDKLAEQEQNEIDGDTAFKLHGTFGFPFDLTQLMAEEQGLKVDENSFKQLMEEDRERGRGSAKDGSDETIRELTLAAARNGEAFFEHTRTDDSPKFAGFNHESTMLGWVDSGGQWHDDMLESGELCALILQSTSFYAEQGGQVGDVGEISQGGGAFMVLDTQRVRGTVLHIGRLFDGWMMPGKAAAAEVDPDRRSAIMANHTATHLLNWSLRQVLGDHVMQKGSLVDDGRTRFDFSHHQPMTADELERIEGGVQQQIDHGYQVFARQTALESAHGVHSLRAVFGEKYPDQVRVVSIGPSVEDLLATPQNQSWSDHSIELCGGTHVANTSDISAFALLSEEGVAQGVRRVVGVSGELAQQAQQAATDLHHKVEELAAQSDEQLADGLSELHRLLLDATLPIVERTRLQDNLAKLQTRVRQQQKAEAQEQGAEVREQVAELLTAASEVAGTRIIVGEVTDAPPDQVRSAIDWLRQKAGSAAVMLFATGGKKLMMLAALTPDLVERGIDAKELVREAGKVVGGGGGGRPDMAQGGGKDASKVPAAIAQVRGWLGQRLA